METVFQNRQLTIRNEPFNFNKRLVLLIACWILLMIVEGCNIDTRNDHSRHLQTEPKEQYTCPMPEDSVFSDKPGKCPKCGMDLIKVEPDDHQHEAPQFTCPMHPQIIRDNAGTCPICGMDLVKKENQATATQKISLETLLKPTNEFVIASLPLAGVTQSEEPMEIDVLGYSAYNLSSVGIIAVRTSGRIEKLYVKYRYQKITKGQRIMDIYSPELMAAQQNLLFLLKNDINNTSMIQAARQKLLLLGVS